MRNFWIFLRKYNTLFLFLFFFILSLYLVVKNNSYQNQITLNSTNQFVGTTYSGLNRINSYLRLNDVNDSLIIENARLKTLLINKNNRDSLSSTKITDTVSHHQYTCLPARVIKNSITLRNNTITINKGSADGIEVGMAVISSNKGVVGFVRYVSEHLAIVQSLLNKNTKISVMLKKSKATGTLVWGDGNTNFATAYVKEIPEQYKKSVKDTVETSGNGSFPRGILVGKISKPATITGDSFISFEINLFTNFNTLQYVYVIKDKLALEQKTLEEKITNEQ